MRSGWIIGAIVALGLLGACNLSATSDDAPAAAPAAAPASPPRPDESLAPPGDGSVKCPGNAACPEITLAPGGFGTAGAEPGMNAEGKPRMLICTGDAATTDVGCPAGYIGRLLLASDYQPTTVCRQGQNGCKPRSWALMCADGARGCPMLPKF
jgi:hypothetical protein